MFPRDQTIFFNHEDPHGLHTVAISLIKQLQDITMLNKHSQYFSLLPGKKQTVPSRHLLYGLVHNSNTREPDKPTCCFYP
jgi:hypothetical protein